MPWFRRPGFVSLVVMFALGCSNSSSSSSSGCNGSSATQFCEVELTATLCADRITVQCFDGAKPETNSQCDAAFKQGTDVVYCCTNTAAPSSEGGGGGS